MSTQILALGGGGFSMAPDAQVTALDRFALELTGKASPMVCFAPTASADDARYINKFLTAFGALGVRTQVLTLWDGAKTAVDRLSEADLVYVGGGSTVNLLALWRAHGVDKVLETSARERGLVLTGLSAGGACWFDSFVTDSFGDLAPYRGGLGLAPGSFCPHYDGEAERAPMFTGWVADGSLPSGWGVDDGAAVHLVDGQVVGTYAERTGAQAWYVRASNSPAGSGVLADPASMKQL